MFRNIKNLMAGFLLVLGSLEAYAQVSLAQIDIIKNDKEVFISVLSRKEQRIIHEKYKDQIANLKIKTIFYTSVQNLINEEKRNCEFGLIDTFRKDLKLAGIDNSQNSMKDIFKMLRVTSAVDDILYQILADSHEDMYELDHLNLMKNPKKSKINKEIAEANDLTQLFSAFESYPDEKTTCSYQAYWYLRSNINGKDGKKLTTVKSKKLVKSLINEAYAQKLISLNTYHKLRYLHRK